MTPAIAVAIIGFILDRAQAGFPILSELFRRRKKDIESAAREADVEAGGVPPAVGAAPGPVKEFVIAHLTRVRDRSSGWTRVLLTFVINIAPTLADEVWDRVAELLSGREDAVPPAVAAATSNHMAVAFADACDAVDID